MNLRIVQFNLDDMRNLINRIFNRWTKWELYKKDYESGFSLYNIYVKSNRYNGIRKFKQVTVFKC